jgi:hypothetical protein
MNSLERIEKMEKIKAGLFGRALALLQSHAEGYMSDQSKWRASCVLRAQERLRKFIWSKI